MQGDMTCMLSAWIHTVYATAKVYGESNCLVLLEAGNKSCLTDPFNSWSKLHRGPSKLSLTFLSVPAISHLYNHHHWWRLQYSGQIWSCTCLMFLTEYSYSSHTGLYKYQLEHESYWFCQMPTRILCTNSTHYQSFWLNTISRLTGRKYGWH